MKTLDARPIAQDTNYTVYQVGCSRSDQFFERTWWSIPIVAQILGDFLAISENVKFLSTNCCVQFRIDLVLPKAKIKLKFTILKNIFNLNLVLDSFGWMDGQIDLFKWDSINFFREFDLMQNEIGIRIAKCSFLKLVCRLYLHRISFLRIYPSKTSIK